MKDEKKHINYTAADIEKYHKGLLSPGEMNALEKAALDDPFLADAVEGYHNTTADVSDDLAELQKRLEERSGATKVIPIGGSGKRFQWWRSAAAIAILGGVGFLTYRITSNRGNDSIARVEQKKENVPAGTAKDSSGIVSPGNTDRVIVQPPETTIASATKKPRKISNSETAVSSIATSVTSPAVPSAVNADEGKRETVSTGAKPESNQNATALSLPKQTIRNDQVKGYTSMDKENGLNEQLRMNYFRGRVKDAHNDPLPFANITNTRDNIGTYSDAKGYFTLISPDSVLNVQVRSVGFENNVARLKSNLLNNEVVMQDDKSAPDKIISYKKRDTTLQRGSTMKLEEPEPADGWSNYGTYLANNVNVPQDLSVRQDRGQVQLSFEVNEKGDPINIKVEKSLCQKCDEEAVRLVKEGPKWKKKNKKAKRVTVDVPFD